jgi:hypothetical protein
VVIGTLLIECRGGEEELRETCGVLDSLDVEALRVKRLCFGGVLIDSKVVPDRPRRDDGRLCGTGTLLLGNFRSDLVDRLDCPT